MAKGEWEKCLAQRAKADGNVFTCYKKYGHHVTGGRDNRKHVDNKQSPAVYWEAEPCGYILHCPNPPDPFNARNNSDETYCEEHWIKVLAVRAELARKGIY